MNKLESKKYNILYTTSFSHMMGGGQWSLYYLIKHLDKRRFRPIVLCPEQGELAENMKRVGAKIVCLNVGRLRHLNPFVIKRIVSILKENRIDLIHTDSSTETFYAGIAGKIARIPLIWHIRVSEREWFMDRVLSTFCARLILVAEAIQPRFKWLEKRGKLSIVYNGIDLKTFDAFSDESSIRNTLNIRKSTVLLGCIGRIEKRKGQEYLIRAMKYIKHASLLLVGRGNEEYVKRTREISKKLNVSDRVVFAGHREDIPSVLKAIDILVFPTVSGEGFSRVILEAMAAGKPVVATAVGGNPEAVEDSITGYIVPPRDAPALTSKIKELIKNKEKRGKMGKAGRKRVEELFTIQRYVQGVQGVYREVLSGRA